MLYTRDPTDANLRRPVGLRDTRAGLLVQAAGSRLPERGVRLWHGGRATVCGATAGRSPAPWIGHAAGLALGPLTGRAGGEAAARHARRLCEAGGTARPMHGACGGMARRRLGDAARPGGDTALAAPRLGGLAWWRLGEAAAG